jgi:hypothetical protein
MCPGGFLFIRAKFFVVSCFIIHFLFLALEAIAIGLHSALVWDIATWEESSNVNAQASKELCVENAVKVISNILQAISFRILRHVDVDNLYFLTTDVIGEGLFPQVDELIFFVRIETVPRHFQLG